MSPSHAQHGPTAIDRNDARKTHPLACALLGAAALLVGSVGTAAAAPAGNANCVAEAATSFLHGDLGPALSQQARGVGLGWFVGGGGSGLAPTDPPDCG
jgi:hypothetical protein